MVCSCLRGQVLTPPPPRRLPKHLRRPHLHQYSDDEKCGALGMLYDVLSTQELKVEALENGTIEAATDLLASSTSSNPTKSNAAMVLASLALLKEGRARMAEASSVPVLTAGCNDKDEDVAISCAEAVVNLVRFRDGWAIVVENTRAVPNLVKALSTNPAVITCFVHLTALYYEGTEAVLAAGATRRLVALLRETDVPLYKKHGCMAMRSLANNDDGKDKLIQAGAVDALVRLLTDEDAEVRQVSAGALLTLCVALEAKELFMDCGQDAVDSMCRMLRDESEHVRTNATKAIRCLAELPTAKKAFCRALVQDLEQLTAVFGSSASAPMCDLLEARRADVRAAAVTALASFSATDEGTEDVVNALHIVPRLCKTLVDADLDAGAQRSAARCLQALLKYRDVHRAFAKQLEGDLGKLMKPVLATNPSLGRYAKFEDDTL